MLADYLKGDCWHTVMDGVQLFKLPAGRLTPGAYTVEPCVPSPLRYELFFCCGGSFTLERRKNSPMMIGEQEIFIFSDLSDVKTISVSDALIGYCVSIDPAEASPVFESLYQVLGHLDICDGRIGQMLADHGGCMRIHNSCWNQAAFAVLRSLPYQEQGPCCIFKIAELFYLLCAHHALLDNIPDRMQVSGYPAGSIYRVRDYMENHLDEKLTILSLSRQFHLSSTALKSGFRALYGQPLHAWLQNRRIQQAAELLQFSDMTVLQIAQSVGYEGVSQFNVVFKRIYGIPPSQYRKMSETGRS